MSDKITLLELAEFIPLGFECRACGGSVYNHLKRAGTYEERGEACCGYMREWVDKAKAARAEQPTRSGLSDERSSRMAGRGQSPGLRPAGGEG